MELLSLISLSLNGVASSCVAPLPTPPISLISDCGDFVSGPAAWPYVLVATTVDSGLSVKELRHLLLM